MVVGGKPPFKLAEDQMEDNLMLVLRVDINEVYVGCLFSL